MPGREDIARALPSSGSWESGLHLSSSCPSILSLDQRRLVRMRLKETPASVPTVENFTRDGSSIVPTVVKNLTRKRSFGKRTDGGRTIKQRHPVHMDRYARHLAHSGTSFRNESLLSAGRVCQNSPPPRHPKACWNHHPGSLSGKPAQRERSSGTTY